MGKDVFTYLIGGRAGEGVRKAGSLASRLFASKGRHVFQMDDYMSLIKGGHNFTVVSTSTGPIMSHYVKADLIVCLDERSYHLHKDDCAPGGTIVYNSDGMKEGEGVPLPMTAIAKKYPKSELRIGVTGPSVLLAALGVGREEMEAVIRREYSRDTDNNLAFAAELYDLAAREIGGKYPLSWGEKSRPAITGNEAIALGAAAAGLDIYIAYPMTPTSSILHFLARHAEDLKMAVIHAESEIAVANMAIGAASAGARVMVGTSGGGFALMEEALSLAGMTETPLLCIMGSRPGPSTGVPTYTEQADLRFALNQGHGEFPRIVASPGDLEEAFYLTAELLRLVWMFQTPGILLTEKHCAESLMTVDIDPRRTADAMPEIFSGNDYGRYRITSSGVSPLLFPPSGEIIKWNSYEHDEEGLTSEEAAIIVRMHDKRAKKGASIVEHLKGMETVKIHGSGEPVIFAYGSTAMSVREALDHGNIRARLVQPLYLEPFPLWEVEGYRDRHCIVVEMSSTGQFATLLREKAGIIPSVVIKKYDGRPFDPGDLAFQIDEALAAKRHQAS
jgi:2-oxoglutarate/2-oxoacid ferredoxin oxidoreductase subunit alpha